jgi:uncharacterized protein YukE
MTSKLSQVLLFAAAGVIALVFVKLMFDISKSMNEMTGYVGVMSEDIGEIQDIMRAMNESMLRMEKSVQGMGQAFGQGSKQFQQMNPAGMMQQVMPGGSQSNR